MTYVYIYIRYHSFTNNAPQKVKKNNKNLSFNSDFLYVLDIQ